MNKCTERDIQEMLPDMLHRALPADARRRVEAHLATCQECREDLEVLRTVNSAVVFAPRVDVDRVVAQIPPYRMIMPGVEHPARPRVVSWLVAASMAVVVLGGGSLLLLQPKTTARSVAVTSPVPGGAQAIPSGAEPVSTRNVKPPAPSPTTVTAAPRPHALALAADVDGLSDGSLVQLMNEMNRFDALPASEPDPVISVDSGTNLEQD